MSDLNWTACWMLDSKDETAMSWICLIRSFCSICNDPIYTKDSEAATLTNQTTLSPMHHYKTEVN